MSDLIEAMAKAVHEHLCRRDIMQYLDNPEDCEGLATAALAALRETHHLVQKDQEPVGWLYALIKPLPNHEPYLIDRRRMSMDPTVFREQALYTLEKRHD
jgi:hypothetical protein